ncbi:MAG: helix-turn-helix domain-containing protein [Gemmatimonadetes bacterium]|nr:helix-turn-helix domain-containing protein [Gemmatimonadota bacterium]
MPTPPPTARTDAPVITTLLSVQDRQQLDAAGGGSFRTMHRASIPELYEDLRQRRASAVMVSLATYSPATQPALMRMVREFPSVPTIAMFSALDAGTPRRALELGQCGIRTVIDARQPAGWQELRALLHAQRSGDIRRRALCAIAEELPRLRADASRFFEHLFLHGASITTSRDLARSMHVKASSLMSRFFRMNLPSPKLYLIQARLVLAARMLENPGLAISTVAYELDYSSAQSFGRHVRTFYGFSASTFRDRYDGEGALTVFLERMIRPHREKLERLSPTGIEERRPGLRATA